MTTRISKNDDGTFNIKKTPFDNKDRNRYYGLRIGDIVNISLGYPKKTVEAEVIEYCDFDNNRVILNINGDITDWVAEWCKIVTKVEDRKL